MHQKYLAGLMFASLLCAQTADKPAFDPRLSVHTLVREDVFAGFMGNDMARLDKGEENLRLLLKERPAASKSVEAWMAGIELYRAALAYEKKDTAAFAAHFSKGKEMLVRGGVAPITGGMAMVVADRMPQTERAALWDLSYTAFREILKEQGASLEKMPLHFKGELLAGLAQSAYRTNRTEEGAQYIEKMIALLPGTAYEARARRVKENPELASKVALGCQSCHEPGRLDARRAALAKASN
jgi:hypothetical protein